MKREPSSSGQAVEAKAEVKKRKKTSISTALSTLSSHPSPAVSPSSAGKLWVKYGDDIIRVSTIDCECAYDFIKAIIKELSPDLDKISIRKISIHLTENSAAVDPRTPIAELVELSIDNSNNPIIVKTTVRDGTNILTNSGQSLSVCQIPFYNSISDAIETDDWLSFKTKLLGSELDRLYIRDSYKLIAANISNMRGIKKAIITGTPGIGKSMFLIYLLHKLVKEGKRVLFIYHPNMIFYDGDGSVFELEKAPLVQDHSFWSADLWCLFDAKNKSVADLNPLPYDDCNFILSTSPRREMVNDFKKSRTLKAFMPLWTEVEMAKIAPYFPSVHNWLDRFKFLGGIPRFVLELTEDEPQEILEEACRELTQKSQIQSRAI